MPSLPKNASRRRPCAKSRRPFRAATAAMLLASPTAAADCISLKGSKLCPAFDAASISTSSNITQFYGFLNFVDDLKSFDAQFQSYLTTSYIKDKYQSLFGCSNLNLTNSSDLYARFTQTVLCNAIVQMSVDECNLSDQQARSVCADTCADFAQSEVYLTSDSDICADPASDLASLIRADFVNCSLPKDALMGDCITGSENEPENCGYGNSTIGFCSYCAAGGINSTDTCCYNGKATDRCDGVKLPKITSTMVFTAPAPTSTSSHSSTATAETDSNNNSKSGNDSGLSGGAIAGIVVGTLAGVAVLGLLLFFCLRTLGRRRGSQSGSILNQPSPARHGQGMTQVKQDAPQGYEVLPGGRIARMSALEGHSGDSPTHHEESLTAGAAAFAAGRAAGHETQSSSDGYHDSPEHQGVLRPPPTHSRRAGSLSSGSALGGGSAPQSPTSGGYSSPQGVASQQSEQLPFFKDYYSQDDIHPTDRVAVLWAYSPRAADEFTLERGDMLKVVGIWDDGWATGVMCDERADDWEARRATQRDSGVSNTSAHRDISPINSGEIKAFPLVCVCLPEHWKKTIDGDVSTDSGANYNPTSS